jgi:hypothetical protein
MSELQNPETNHADEALLLAGYLKPKDLAKAPDVSERTIARWHHFREGRRASKSAGRSITAKNP